MPWCVRPVSREVIPSCNLCSGRSLVDEVAELREVFGDGLVGVFGGFVFEDDVASVFSGFQDLDEASQVRRDSGPGEDADGAGSKAAMAA